MTSLLKVFFLLMLVVNVACNNNKTSETSQAAKENKTETSENANKANPGSAQTEGMDGIIGEWRQILITEDKNGDEQIDESERAAGSKIDDYLKLNSDGSAVFHVFEANGTFRVKTNESSGTKYLYLYDRENNESNKGAIHSVTKDEMILIHKMGGDSYTIWKRQ